MPAEKPSTKVLSDQPIPEAGTVNLPQDPNAIEISSDGSQSSDWDDTDVSQIETATKLKKYYQRTKRRKQWLKAVGIMGFMLILLSGIGMWLWDQNKSFRVGILKIISPVVSIHLKPEMISVPAGNFLQGDVHSEDHPSEHPLRKVTIKTFAIGKFEVTFDEYDRFAIATDRPLPRDESWGRGSRPVINVSWEDAMDYAEWLSQQTGSRFRLPTESEWEYAARNRGKNTVWAGTSENMKSMNYAWFNTNSGGRTQPVGTKTGNSLGLNDMSGNVWEWVEDCWHDDYTEAPTDGSAWLEMNEGNCGIRMRRGGGWTDSPESLRSSSRNWYSADTRSILIGFRLAQELK